MAEPSSQSFANNPSTMFNNSNEFILKTFCPEEMDGARALANKYYFDRVQPYIEHLDMKKLSPNTPTPWEKYTSALASQFVFNFPVGVYGNHFTERFSQGLSSPMVINSQSLALHVVKKEPVPSAYKASPCYLLDRGCLPDWLRSYDGEHLEVDVNRFPHNPHHPTIKEMIIHMLSLGFDYSPVTPYNSCAVMDDVRAYTERTALSQNVPPVAPPTKPFLNRL